MASPVVRETALNRTPPVKGPPARTGIGEPAPAAVASIPSDCAEIIANVILPSGPFSVFECGPVLANVARHVDRIRVVSPQVAATLAAFDGVNGGVDLGAHGLLASRVLARAVRASVGVGPSPWIGGTSSARFCLGSQMLALQR